MARKVGAAALLVLAALLAAQAAAVQQQQQEEDDINELPAPGGGLVRFHGASPSFDVATDGNASFVNVRLGKVYEASPSSGQAVNGRRIMSLAAASPTYSQGNFTTLDGQNVTYVSMRLPLSGLVHNFSECGGGAPAGYANASTAASQGFIQMRVYFGFTDNATFAFGANNSVTAAANSTKFTLEAASWPFCDAANSFVVELHLKTGARNGSHPKDVDEDGDAGDSDAAGGAANSTSPSNSSSTPGASTNSSSTMPPASRHRRMLANGNGGGNGNGGAGSSNRLNGYDGGGSNSSNAHAQPGGGGWPRNPRVAGASPRRFALLAGNAAQAVALSMEPYAFEAVDGSTLMNVTADIDVDGEHTVIRLAFPAFVDSLYYDPSLAMTDAAAAGYSSAELAALNVTLVAAPTKNAGAARAGVAGAASLLGAALLAAALT